MHTNDCFLNYLGQWAMYPVRLLSAWRLIAAGQANARAVDPESERVLYENVDGVAIVTLQDALMKGWSKFGGTSTVHARKAVRTAADDPKVQAIMLHIDSPGGTVAGTSDLADDVRSVDRRKPVYAHADDMIASAAYWIGSGARRLTANRTALVGSIGVLSVIEDSSEAYKAEGITVHVITNDGAEVYKGAGVPGSKVTDEQLAYVRGLINQTATAFIRDISKGGGGRRALTLDEARKVATGQVWNAPEAKGMGLIDAVESLDEAMAAVRADLRSAKRQASAAVAMAALSIAEKTV